MVNFFKLGKLDRKREDAAPSSNDPAASAEKDRGKEKERDPAAKDKSDKKRDKKGKPDDNPPGSPVLSAPSGAADSIGASGERPLGERLGNRPGNLSTGPSVNDFISKTKAQQRQGLKPSGPELFAYARYLGVDPVADHDLLWVAVEALEAPLPSEWSEHFDSSDRVFYYHATTRVSSWTHPLEQVYRDTYKTIVSFRNSSMSTQERADELARLQHEIQQMERDVHREITLWTEHADEQGHRFYFNRETRQSTWTDPRPAKCHVLYLKMKMLRVLAPNGISSTGASAPGGASKVNEGRDGVSRFAPLYPLDPERTVDDPARNQKRPKVAGEVSPGGSTDALCGDLRGDRSLTGSPVDSPAGDHGKRKKDRQKKHRDRPGGDGLAAVPPPFQGMSHSRSEPIVKATSSGMSTQPLLSNEDGLGGMGSMQPGLSSLSFGEPEGLSNVGRVKVKAGIRLQPLAKKGQVSELSSLDAPPTLGMHGSASVPTLQPLRGDPNSPFTPAPP